MCNESDEEVGLGTRVVEQMLLVVDDLFSHKVYFDIFFTSFQLLLDLTDLGFRATGTIRENRIKKCPIKSVKDMKKTGRCTLSYSFDKTNSILFVRWMDNSIPTFATNFDGIEPLQKASRKSKGRN